MKQAILFLLLAGTFSAKAQSLKDLLYSGKLKSDSNSVVRASDDLKSKIDTSTRKVAEPEKPKVLSQTQTTPAQTAPVQSTTNQTQTAVVPVTTAGVIALDTVASKSGNNTNTGDPATGTGVVPVGAATGMAATTDPAAKAAPAPKTNNKIWKDYTDSLNKVITAEVLNTKKIKKGSYAIQLDYDLAPDGSVTITNVTSTPENPQLQAAVKDRVESAAPQMNPIPDATPTSKKLKRRYTFYVTKD